jgi:PAS domain S-box-containing protein
MKKSILLISFLIINSVLIKLTAQNSEVDSLENLLLEHTNEDTIRVNLLNNIAYILYTIDSEKSLKYAEKAGVIADKLSFKNGQSTSFNVIGINHYMKGNYPQAFDYFQKAMKIMEEIGNKEGVASCLNNIGLIQRKQGNYTEALDYLKKSLKLREELGIKELIPSNLNNIGNIYINLGKYSEAVECYEKSLKINEELGNKKGISYGLNNIGTIYYYLGNYTKSLEYFHKALKLKEELGNKPGICESYFNIADVYRVSKNYNKALEYCTKSLELAKEIEFLDLQKDIHLQFAEIYASSNNYKKAYNNYVLFKELSDSLFNEENVKKITGLEYQYKHEKEKQTIELEQQKKDAVKAEEEKRQKVIRNSFIAGFILMLFVVLVVLRSFLHKRKANRILALQKQRIEENNKELYEQKEEISSIADKLVDAYYEVDKLSIVAKETDNAVFIIDENDNVEWVNEGCTRMYGYQFEEFIDKFGSNIKSINSTKNFTNLLEDCKNERRTIIYESSIVHKSGETVYAQTTLTPILDNAGNVKKLIAIDTDISKMKDLENFKESMIQMIVHDLKNPLNSILGFSGLKPSKKHNFYIHNVGKSMLNLVENIMDVQKYENSKINLQIEECVIQELVKKSIDDINLFINLKKIKVENNIKDIQVNCDKEIITRVFVNLLTNASKYVDHEGSIKLSYEIINKNDKSFYKFLISDNGVGIDPEMLDKIFDKYAQAEAKKLGITHSTGLGLTFCKMVAEAHNGEIGVESEIENLPAGRHGGSTFWFTLPA